MAAVVRLKFGVPTLRYEMAADDYWAVHQWIEHDAARQRAVDEQMRLAKAHNAAKIAQHGTMADLHVASGTGVAVGTGGKARKLPRHGVGR